MSYFYVASYLFEKFNFFFMICILIICNVPNFYILVNTYYNYLHQFVMLVLFAIFKQSDIIYIRLLSDIGQPVH